MPIFNDNAFLAYQHLVDTSRIQRKGIVPDRLPRREKFTVWDSIDQMKALDSSLAPYAIGSLRVIQQS